MTSSEDIPRKKISQGIVQSIGHYWQKHQHEDFQVNVEGESIKVHSFMLASCSEFFRNLLNSNMKEKQEMKVDLPNISSTTFRLILETLYTGCELLTKYNVLEVWSAVHQLQIHFLMQHCEDFIVDNVTVETVSAYKKQAEIFQCRRFSDRVFPFLCENFMAFRKTEFFQQLDLNELTKLIKSDQLDVRSEDFVLYSIYDWVSYGETAFPKVQKMDENALANNLVAKAEGANANSDKISHVINNELKSKEEDQCPLLSKDNQCNERALHLHKLIKSSRYLLASEDCLKNLLTKTLTQKNTQISNILSEALAFKSSGKFNGFWPKAAIHRDSSTLEHVGVMCGSLIGMYSFKKDKWFSHLIGGLQRDAQVINLNGRLFGLKRNEDATELVHYFNSNWVSMLTLNVKIHLVLPHDKSIYIFSSENVITKYLIASEVTTSEPYILETEHFSHTIGNAKYAMSFHNHILVFESVKNNRADSTAVHSWNLQSNVWTRVANLDFSADKMTSFSDDHFSYVLDKAGNLFRVDEAEAVQFSFIEQIWDFRVDMKGVVLFRKCLYVCGEDRGEGEYFQVIEGVYTSLTFVKKTHFGPCFVPFLMNSSLLTYPIDDIY
ncbi:uncharacterized protein LOC106050463 isoform X2 [Biomphalaria glabrata]|uniref:Uncharacterized protein LOC106050463 isoform X2 n=1 Tax=Biomphalaria glabrata TaxID=6526 RepID=A0A9U8DU74_BIOGL|nr:uncharacterized protein LOC106050463 isoform X2 [Biomphalaria glabrata]